MNFNLKTPLLLVILALVYNAVHSQCNENMSTNPSNPVNNHLPDIVQPNPTAPFIKDERYLNGFNWWSPNQYVLEPNMEFNPGQPYPNMNNVQHPDILPYYSYLNKYEGREEMNPLNGWEILLVNLGRFPDNVTPLSENTYAPLPYIVLYNRYSGVVRVFVQYGRNSAPNGAVDGVKISLYYLEPQGNSNNVSGVLRLGAGSDLTLDQKTEVINLTTIAPTNGLTGFWMSGDFQIAYDPCVCWYPSNLRLGFEFFKETELKLTGRGITTVEALVDANGNINNHPFLGGMNFDDDSDDASDGYLVYKHMNSMVDNYIQRVTAHRNALIDINRHNDLVEWNLLMLEVFKLFVTQGKSAASSSTEMQSLKLITPEYAFDYSSSITNTKKQDDKLGKFLSEVTKIFGKYSEYLGVEGFSKKAVPDAPSSPVVSFTETKFSGKMIERTPAQGPSFPTPESFKNLGENIYNPASTEYAYPIYNEALGTFALLEKPKVKLADMIKHRPNCNVIIEDHFMNPPPSNPNGSPILLPWYTRERWASTIQIQLENDLKYTINPALDIKNHEIEAWFEIETSVQSEFPQNPYDDPEWDGIFNFGYFPPATWWSKPRNNPEFNVNVLSNTIDINDYNEIIPYEELTNHVPPTISTINYSLSSVALPIDAFKTYPVSFSIMNEYNRYYRLSESPNCDGIIPEILGDFQNGSISGTGYSWFDFLEYGHKLKIEKLTLKIKLSIEFETFRDDGVSPNMTEQIFSYDFDMSDPNSAEIQSIPIVEDIKYSPLDIGRFPKDLYVENDIHFDGSDIPNFVLAFGNVYRAFAYNSVIIDANLTVAPGYSVVIRAGEQIETFPESSISPEITLEINEFFKLDKESNPMPPVSEDYVSDFCNGLLVDIPNYQANERPIKNIVSTIEPESQEDEILTIEDIFSLNLYPNPTGGNATLELTIGDRSVINLQVTDISGKPVVAPITNGIATAGVNRYELPTESLASGIYLVHLFVDGAHHVKRIVKQ